MKIGIITFHFSRNYGAALQAYGLQEYLKTLGHDVYIIDYRPQYLMKHFRRDSARIWLSKNPFMCIKRFCNYMQTREIRHQRHDGFVSFVNNYQKLYPYRDGEDFNGFDFVFIGSDQVWSPFHTGGQYDDIMFGVGFKCKVISYAPSCSQASLNREEREYLKEHLDYLYAISVREHHFKDMLQPLTRKEIQVVADPSLLAGAAIFEKIAAPINRNKPYVLIYEIVHHQQVQRIAKEIATQLNADIVELTNGMLGYHNKTMDEGASPEKFLGYIKEASCVVTTSFHGTAFSLLFQKPFYMVKQDNSADDRMSNLLKLLGLQERIISMDAKVKFGKINYTPVSPRLEEYRHDSILFIDKSLNE